MTRDRVRRALRRRAHARRMDERRPAGAPLLSVERAEARRVAREARQKLVRERGGAS